MPRMIGKTSLLEIFNANCGIVCCVGAGGKKTTMYRLANEHTGRVGITATSHIEYFPKALPATKYIENEHELLNKVGNDSHSRIIAFAQPSERKGRRAGISLNLVQTFKEIGNFKLLLVKADGARGRYIKAPAEHEPPLPDCVNTVIPIISAKVIGQALTVNIAHRVELISKIAGIDEHKVIEPVHIARIFTSPHGALKNAGTARIIPLINMVDDSEREQLARESAMEALSLSDRFNYVVLAAMKNDDPVIDIIKR
jgi:probable selenium-dependent hydroxylase accessory protein YqeC